MNGAGRHLERYPVAPLELYWPKYLARNAPENNGIKRGKKI
jgi:hypothetical protein